MAIHSVINRTMAFPGFEDTLNPDQSGDVRNGAMPQGYKGQEGRAPHGGIQRIIDLLDRRTQDIGLDLGPQIGKGPASGEPETSDRASDKFFSRLSTQRML